jgi:hypothetical protein
MTESVGGERWRLAATLGLQYQARCEECYRRNFCAVRELGGELKVEFRVSGTKVEAMLPLEWAPVK